jgi:hypothetical protein
MASIKKIAPTEPSFDEVVGVIEGALRPRYKY